MQNRTIIFINSRAVKKELRKQALIDFLHALKWLLFAMLVFVGIMKGLEYSIFHGGF